jgi:soluble lytic murein transglycosylase-like protein
MDINALINDTAAAKGIPALLLKRQVEKESKSNPNAIGDLGAKNGKSRGLMQIQEKTAINELGVAKKDLNKLLDPKFNLDKGTDYINKIISDLSPLLPKTYDDYWASVFMAYNSGPSYVKKALTNLQKKGISEPKFQDILNEMQLKGFGTTPKFSITVPYVQYILGKSLKAVYSSSHTLLWIGLSLAVGAYFFNEFILRDKNETIA